MRSIRQTGAGFFTTRLLVAAGALFITASPLRAQLNLSASQRAADGTYYQVVTLPQLPLLGGAEQFRVTTVAGGPLGLRACSQIGDMSGDSASALVGAFSPQTLHLVPTILRTGVFSLSDATVTFSATGSGKLTLGSGPGARDVCRQAANCAGGATDATVVTLRVADARVPSACLAFGVTSSCSGSDQAFTIAFGLDVDEDANCDSTPTVNTTVCAAPPTDGFTLLPNEVIVFIYDQTLLTLGFTAGAAGFGIDTNGFPPRCALSMGAVVNSGARALGAPVAVAPGPPTL